MTYVKNQRDIQILDHAYECLATETEHLEQCVHDRKAACDRELDARYLLKSTKKGIRQIERRVFIYDTEQRIRRFGNKFAKRLPTLPRIKVSIER